MLSLDGAGGPVTMIYETARAEIFSPHFHLQILSFHLRLRQFDRLDVGISKRWLASSCFPHFLAFDFHNKEVQTFAPWRSKKSKAHPTYQQSKFIQGASIYAESLWLSSKISCEDVLRFRIYAYSRSFDLPLVGSNWVTSFKVYVPEFLLQPVA